MLASSAVPSETDDDARKAQDGTQAALEMGVSHHNADNIRKEEEPFGLGSPLLGGLHNSLVPLDAPLGWLFY